VEYHREASAYYQGGRDYADAAHHALVAHGHALEAIDHGSEAGKYYSDRDGEALQRNPDPAPRIAAQSFETSEALEPGLSAAGHRMAAAEHHHQAARHHIQACKHSDRKRYVLAVQEAHIAYIHSQSALFHGNEAVMRHIERYGDSELNTAPTARPSDFFPELCRTPGNDRGEKAVKPRSNVLPFFIGAPPS
jgi:hypothetical protein